MSMKDKQQLIENQLRTTTRVKNYNGWKNKRTEFGYHSFNLDGIDIRGQRNPKDRIDIFSKYIDFKDKVVVDFGCNVGGMLFHISNLKEGYGFDFAENDIKAANNIKNILERPELNFNVMDLDKVNNFNVIDSFFNNTPDVFFLLSIGGWIENHLKLYEYCLSKKADIILELNHQITDQYQIDFFKNQGAKPQLISSNSEDDIMPAHKQSRATYFIPAMF